MTENHSENFWEFETHFEKIVKNAKALYVFATVIVGVGFPIIEAGLMEGREFGDWIVHPVILIVLPFHFAGLLVLAWRPEIGTEFYFKYRKVFKDWKKAIKTVEEQEDVIGAKDLALQTLGLLHQVVAHNEDRIEDFSTLSFAELMDVAEQYLHPIELGRHGFFGYKDNEYFNIAVYFHDPVPDGDGRLHLLGRKTNIPTEYLQNRSWEIGRGQVGHTFARNECVITPDVRAHQELSRDQSGSDNDFYLSLAAIPLRCDPEFDEQSERIGVLIVTSSIPDTFTEWDEPALENLAFVFSRYLDKVHARLLEERRAGHGYPEEDRGE